MDVGRIENLGRKEAAGHPARFDCQAGTIVLPEDWEASRVIEKTAESIRRKGLYHHEGVIQFDPLRTPNPPLLLDIGLDFNELGCKLAQ